MPRYRFNVPHDERVFWTPKSQELPGIEETEARVLQALAEMAKDAIPATMNRVLAMEVADEIGMPLLIAKLVLRITRDDCLGSRHRTTIVGKQIARASRAAASRAMRESAQSF